MPKCPSGKASALQSLRHAKLNWVEERDERSRCALLCACNGMCQRVRATIVSTA